MEIDQEQMTGLTFVDYSYLGAVLILVTSFRRKDRSEDAWIAAGLIAASAASLPLVTFVTRTFHHTWDGYLYLAYRASGLDSLEHARLVCSTHWAWVRINVVYVSIPLMVAMAWASDRPKTMCAVFLQRGCSLPDRICLPNETRLALRRFRSSGSR